MTQLLPNGTILNTTVKESNESMENFHDEMTGFGHDPTGRSVLLVVFFLHMS